MVILCIIMIIHTIKDNHYDWWGSRRNNQLDSTIKRINTFYFIQRHIKILLIFNTGLLGNCSIDIVKQVTTFLALQQGDVQLNIVLTHPSALSHSCGGRRNLQSEHPPPPLPILGASDPQEYIWNNSICLMYRAVILAPWNYIIQE